MVREGVHRALIWNGRFVVVQSSEESLFIHGCKLGRTELEHAWGIAIQSMSDNVQTSASTTIGITKTKASTPAELFSQLGNPEELPRLDISVDDSPKAEEKETRTVSISIDRSSTYVRVSGTDETWVRGRFDELREFFSSLRSLFGMDLEFSFFIPMGIVVLTMIGLLLVLIITNNTSFSLWDFATAIAASIVVAVGIGIFLRRQSLTIIKLSGFTRAPWKRGDIIGAGVFIIAVLTLIATIIQGLVH
jgi:hypothetical protein